MLGFLSWGLVVIVTGAALFGVGLGIAKLLARYQLGWFTKHHKMLENTAFSVWCFTVGFVALSPAYYEFPSWPHTLYSVQDGELTKHPWGTFEWGKELAWIPTSSEQLWEMGSITPITSNPKVRRISYQVGARIIDADKYLAAPERRRGWMNGGNANVWDDVKLILNYELYELNNSHSSELAEFYNPLDQIQQARFRKLVEGWFNERLGPKGILVTAGSFQLPNYSR